MCKSGVKYTVGVRTETDLDEALLLQYLEGEWIGVFSQFFNQAFLKTSQTLLLFGQRRKCLDVRHKQVFPKRQTQNVQILTAITERTCQSHKH